MKANLTLLFLSVLFSLFVVNAVLEFVSSTQDSKLDRVTALEMESKISGVSSDLREKMQVVDDLRSRGQKAYPSAYTHHYLEEMRDDQKGAAGAFVPLGMKSHTQYVLCNELGQWAVFDYDRHGFNNDDAVYDLKNTGASDKVILIGDSFVEGQCVQKGEDMASRLRQKGIGAISLGMGGSGPLRELGVLKEYGLKLNPSVVVWFFTEMNDLDDLASETKDVFLRRYLTPNFSQNLIDRQDEIDKTWESFIEEKISEKKIDDTKKQKTTFSLMSSLKSYLTFYQLRKRLSLVRRNLVIQGNLTKFKEVLSQVVELTSDNHIRLVFIYLPSRTGFSNNGDDIRKSIKVIVGELGISFIDMKEIFAKSGRNPVSYFPVPPILHHYTPEGYQTVADEVASYLRSNHLLSDVPGALPAGVGNFH